MTTPDRPVVDKPLRGGLIDDLDRVPIPLVLTDDEGRIVAANGHLHELLGYEHGALRGHPLDTLIPAPSRERHRELVSTSFTEPTDRPMGRGRDLEALREDGSVIPVEISLSHFVQEGVSYCLAAVVDISLRRAALDALVADSAELTAVLDATADAIVVIDEEGRIELVNAAVERTFGRTAADTIGREVSILMPSPDREEHPGHLRRYLETGQAHILGREREVVGLRANGDTFAASLRVTELRRGDRRTFIGVLRDVSAGPGR